MEVQDYRTEYTYETFSFLPELSMDEVYDQIVYIINQGWAPAIEHEKPENTMSHYWNMWKLPLFGTRDPDEVLREIEACRAAYPGDVVRLIGYDNYMQTLGHCFVVYRPRGR
jgi:ribulose-bisphosphate carboxylase small chain